MRAKLLILSSLCGLGLFACGDDDARDTISVRDLDGGAGTGSRPPPGGGVGSGGSGGSRDSGPEEDEDSGLPDTDVASLCRDVDPAPLDVADRDPNMGYNGVSTPTDFIVTRSEAAWLESCALPTLRVTISDGHCPRGDGHELTFFIPADGVEDSNVVIGQNLIMEETIGLTSIRVRYTRPVRRQPDGVWGTCEDASGTLDIVPPLELEKDKLLRGNFTLDLTPCDEADPSLQIVMGSFSAQLPESLLEVCP
jgi:hypothetical protein